VNVAVHHVYDTKPDLVVSGINVGSNTGIGFAFSSGTVGACLEANIIGLPAVAFSQILGGRLFFEWTDNKRFPNSELERLRIQTSGVLDAVFGRLFERPGFWEDPVTWNVNIPSQTAENWEVRDTYLSHTFYGSCFKKVGDTFRHDMDPPTVDTQERADEGVVRRGHVSMSRLDMRTFGQL
jgi:5'-nucleotidase